MSSAAFEPSQFATPAPAAAAIRPGARVRVTQQITARHYALVTPVEGTVVSVGTGPTGSWYTHGREDRLWLERIVLRKADGEITTLNLDEGSVIEPLDADAAGPPRGISA